MRIYIVIVVTGYILGATSMYLAERCDMNEAIKPLVYVINELQGGCR